jgi:hypothetical protein
MDLQRQHRTHNPPAGPWGACKEPQKAKSASGFTTATPWATPPTWSSAKDASGSRGRMCGEASNEALSVGHETILFLKTRDNARECHVRLGREYTDGGTNIRLGPCR